MQRVVLAEPGFDELRPHPVSSNVYIVVLFGKHPQTMQYELAIMSKQRFVLLTRDFTFKLELGIRDGEYQLQKLAYIQEQLNE